MSAYAAIVLLKVRSIHLRVFKSLIHTLQLLRHPATGAILETSYEQIHRIINNAADAYQNAGHVTGSELDSAAYHARFLRHLTALDTAQQQTGAKTFRTEGMPPSFAQGLPPIRPSQSSAGLGLPPLDPYPSHRLHGIGPQHLAPLQIPGPSQSYSTSHGEYGTESATRNGMISAANRTPSMYPAMPPSSEMDQRYFEYMVGEVGEVDVID